MAERNHLRIADHTDASNDDPFAELTRIMGFDPRLPVRRAADEAVQATVDEDDFGIDLEKELMGEFEAEDVVAHRDDVHSPEYQVGTAAQASPDRMDDAGDADVASFREELSFDDDAPVESDAAIAAGYVDVEQARQAALQAEDDFAASLEEELALEDDFMAADAGQDQEDPAADAGSAPVDDFDAEVVASLDEAFELDDDFATAGEAGEEFAVAEAAEAALADAEPVTAAAETAPAAETGDHAFAASMEQPVVEDVLLSGGEAASVDEETQSQQAAAALTAEEEFSADFDTALADIDMDFSTAPAVAALDPVAAENDDFGDEPHLPLSGDAAYEAAPVAEFVSDVDEPMAELDEFSLEDELNALLGNAPDHRPTMPELPAVEAHQVAEEPAHDSVTDEDLAHDLDAVNWEFDGGDNADDAQAPLVSEDADPLDAAVLADHGDLLRDGPDQQPVDAVAAENADGDDDFSFDAETDADLELEFDDDAFDAAISNAIADEEQVSHGSALQEPEQPVVKESDDPYAALAALTASMRPAAPAPSWGAEQAEPVTEQAAEPYEDAGQQDDDGYVSSASYEDFPDIDTVDVPEHAVALADDLDIPELAFEENVPAQPYDDIDAEFASLLNDMNALEKAAPSRTPGYAAAAHDADFDRAFQEDTARPVSHYAVAGAAGAAAYAGSASTAYGSAQDFSQSADDAAGVPGSGQPELQDEFAYDADLDEEMALPDYADAPREQPRRRGLLIAAIVGGVAIVGGIGAIAMAFGEGGGLGAPAIVRVDDGPVKVRPENPGGTTVPNQDNKVYDTVSGGDAAAPQQEKLLTTAEEPIDVPAPALAPVPEARVADAAPANPAPAEAAPADDLPGVAPVGDAPVAAAPQAKSEDRIEQVLREAGVDESVEVAAVAPRKVRTMIVRADGTLVPREDLAPIAEAPAAEPAPTATASVVDPTPSAPEATAEAVPGATFTAPAAPAAGEAAPVETAAEPAAAPAAQTSNTPSSVPVAPARPSDQPVDIVGEVKGDQVAALSPTTAAAGAWSMQIASQPSEASARSSYQDLLGRYGDVLNGRQANIVKAEIAGKGTFWRVRVPTASRNEAVSLCETYKSAGGNCFVSK